MDFDVYFFVSFFTNAKIRTLTIKKNHKMKKLISTSFLLLFGIASIAQETVGERVIINAKDQTYQRGEQRSTETVDKALNKIEEGIGNLFKKKEKKPKKDKSEKENANGESTNSSNTNTNSGASSSKNIQVYSKFDFVPGEKIIGFDDFSNTAVGDFPMGWNTNSSAEIVTLDESSQKWLFMTKDGYFQPEFVKNLPENFTLEFEAFTRYRSNNILEYQFYIYPSANPKTDLSEEYLNNYFQFKWQGCEGSSAFNIVENGETITKNDGLSVKDLNCKDAENGGFSKVKFSIWRQKTRLRIYINETKVLDIPQAFDDKSKYNVFKLGAKYMNYAENENKDEFMVSNIRYAVGAPDTRNKLITEGKLVTRGILFDVNSDAIQASSYGVLKEIATVLKENPGVNINIVGHTDSDGDENANLNLSQNRALAVKNMLSSEFKIDAARMETDGKGESEPSDSNKTNIGKANNRRVEFIKL